MAELDVITAGELIRKLQEYPEDTPVYVVDGDGGIKMDNGVWLEPATEVHVGFKYKDYAEVFVLDKPGVRKTQEVIRFANELPPGKDSLGRFILL